MENCFAKTLKLLRIDKGISQKHLALELGYAQSTVCDWENQKIEPTASAIIKLSKYFDISSDELLGITDETGCKINKTIENTNINNNNNCFNVNNSFNKKNL